uniref:Putative secreted protein n=1 Tax=Ixodes ricinus TaxID=34613 RepID=A0A6B0V784_IXORI
MRRNSCLLVVLNSVDAAEHVEAQCDELVPGDRFQPHEPRPQGRLEELSHHSARVVVAQKVLDLSVRALDVGVMDSVGTDEHPVVRHPLSGAVPALGRDPEQGLHSTQVHFYELAKALAPRHPGSQRRPRRCGSKSGMVRVRRGTCAAGGLVAARWQWHGTVHQVHEPLALFCCRLYGGVIVDNISRRTVVSRCFCGGAIVGIFRWDICCLFYGGVVVDNVSRRTVVCRQGCGAGNSGRIAAAVEADRMVQTSMVPLRIVGAEKTFLQIAHDLLARN